MQLLKGFGKKYFTFSAILATSVEQKLQSTASSISFLLQKITVTKEKDLDEDNSSSELLLVTSSLIIKPCHCNCVYNLKTKLALISYKYIPRCPFYTTYFAFRRSGVHPPFLQF